MQKRIALIIGVLLLVVEGCGKSYEGPGIPCHGIVIRVQYIEPTQKLFGHRPERFRLHAVGVDSCGDSAFAVIPVTKEEFVKYNRGDSVHWVWYERKDCEETP